MSSSFIPVAHPFVAQYTKFNILFSHAQNLSTSPKELQDDFTELSSLYARMLRETPSLDELTTPLSDKISSVQTLRADLTDKLHSVSLKVLKGSPAKSETTCGYSVGGCSGYTNKSFNCWAASALEMAHQNPHLFEAFDGVANFFKDGRSFDNYYLEGILRHFETQVPTGVNLEEALSMYRAIREPVFRIRCLQQLQAKPYATIEVLSRFEKIYSVLLPFQTELPNEETLAGAIGTYNQIREPIFQLKCWFLLRQNPLMTPAIHARFDFPKSYFQIIMDEILNILKEKPLPIDTNLDPYMNEIITGILAEAQSEDAFAAKRSELQMHGQALLDALEAYEIYAKLKEAIPVEITDAVRQAFHGLFGTAEAFSSSNFRNEDACEALAKIMTTYMEILKLDNRVLPSSFFIKETRRHYIPVGEPSPAQPGVFYNALIKGTFTTETRIDHQWNLTLPNSEMISLEDLIADNCTHKDIGDGERTYVLENGQIQKYRQTHVQTFSHGSSKQLSFALNRFNNLYGFTGKNNIQVLANRLIITPPEMSSLGTSEVHELVGFVVHSGSNLKTGHYISYRKVNGRWIEFNDAKLRYVDDEVIDSILYGELNQNYTPYLLYYSLVPPERQESAFQAASAMRLHLTQVRDVLLKASGSKTETALPKSLQPLVTPGPKFHAGIRQICTQIFEGYDDLIGSVRMAQKLGQFINVLHSPSDVIEDTFVKDFSTVPSFQRPTKENILSQFNHFVEHIYPTPCESMQSTINAQFLALDSDTKDMIMTLLVQDEQDRIKFEEALKTGTLQQFILDTIKANPDRNLDLLLIELEKDINQAYVDKCISDFENYKKLFEHPEVTNQDLIDLFNTRFTPYMKGKLFQNICGYLKEQPRYESGEAVFKSNPHFLKYLKPLTAEDILDPTQKLY